MATGGEVMSMLKPEGGWAITGDDYEGIQFIDCDPLTKAEFTAGFAKCDALKIEKETKIEADKASAQAKLAALGLTADDLKALGL